MTISTGTDPAVTVRGRGALPGRRANSRTQVGGGNRNGAGHLVGGRPAPIQSRCTSFPEPRVSPQAPCGVGACRGC